MMKHPNCRRSRLAAAVAGALLTLVAAPSFATGFQLNENSASGLGNAFAAGAAMTDDVSAMWWNPAALSQFKRTQAAAALHIVTPSIKFRDDASAAAANQPLGGNGGDAGGANFVPNMYFSMPINPTWTFGLGINAPFGLVTEWDDGWIGRYQALKSQIKTINVNPVISWQATPQIALGVGINYQWLDATFSNNVNYSGAVAQGAAAAVAAGQIPAALVPAILAATPGLDSKSTAKGDDSAWGWNIGIAWDVSPALRLAAGYRSELDFKVKGNIDFNNPTLAFAPGTSPAVIATVGNIAAAIDATRLYNRGITSDVTIPQIANLSFLWRVDNRWEVMGDAQFTGWSSVSELAFVPTDSSVLPATPLDWDDSWKFALGTTYRYDDRWKARFGIAFDQTPVTNEPTPRLPDSDRWWFAIGGEYRYSPNLKFDAGFVYIKGDDVRMSRNEGSTPTYGLINGKFESSSTIFSIQGTYSF